MKTRFSSIDIRTTVVNLQKSLIGLRLANLYDLSPRVFLLKFSKPDCKKNLIIESGIRIHSTNFVRDKGDHTPAPFSLNLRKYLKTKRLESVKQLGVDRIVDFTFGSGVAVQHLIVELYSIGNIILTDGEYRILAILRTHQYNEDESVAVGDIYPIDRVKLPTEFTESLIDRIIENTQDKKETLKQVFNKSLDFGPELIEHCILSAGLQPSTKLEQYDHSIHNKALRDSFIQGQKIFDNSIQSKGFIVLKDPKQLKPQQQQQQQKKQQAIQQSNTLKISNDISGTTTGGDEKKELVIYEEFVPFLYKQYESKKFIEFDSFDAAVDQFFSEIESQKVEQQRIAQEQVVLKKLDKVKEDQQRRIDSLFANEADNVRKAQLIEANLQEVDQCILIIRSGVASSMDWETLNQLLKEEKKKNPYSVATKIHRLKLESNLITLSLTDGFLYDDNDDDDEDQDDDDEDDDEESNEEDNDKKSKKQLKKSKSSNQKPILIDVDISLSAFANARKYYDTKKQSHEKAQKTISQAEFALKAAEKKTRQQLSESKSKNSMIAMRKVFWFEKFHWFISSDNYIVVSGRDAQQNELLYKKYLEKDDVYVHADIFGSTSCVIKNPNGGEIPPNTLIQAGTMTMCYSNAWSAKVVTSAYWVYSSQVSKTAPSGEYLTTGSFMIRGKKNYLPHSQLVMGFGFMFKIDDSCLGNHLNERKPVFGEGDERLNHSNNNDELSSPIGGDDADGEKHLRKFERTKLKKEQKEQKELDQLEKLAINDNEKSTTTTNTNTNTTTTTTTTNKPAVADKYKIQLVSSFHDDDESDEDDDDEEGQDKEEGRNKGYVSAHQRKLMKKEGITLEEAAILEQQLKKEREEKEKTEKVEKKVKAEPQKHLLPSQKNKLKKIKEKYGDQDEEEREERMKILGSAGAKKENKKKDKKGKKGSKSNNQQPTPKENNKNPPTSSTDKQKQVEDIIKLKEDQKKPSTTTTASTASITSTNTDKSSKPQQEETISKEQPILKENEDEEEEDSESESEGEESSASESEEGDKKRKSRKEKREEKIKEEQEIKRLLEEENSSKAVEDQKDITNIDTLTGQPREDDILHFAIPVVAPYSVFNNYKYKVKLTPGHLKRGKAAKQAAQVILQNPQMSKREKELIKHVKDEDLTSNMLADVRLHAPNLLQAQKKEKKERKDRAKERANEIKDNYKDKETGSSSSTTTTTTTNNTEKSSPATTNKSNSKK